jgi:hypothetical protein
MMWNMNLGYQDHKVQELKSRRDGDERLKNSLQPLPSDCRTSFSASAGPSTPRTSNFFPIRR